MDAGAKRDVRLWQNLCRTTGTGEQRERIPEQSETSGSKTAYDVEERWTTNVIGWQSIMGRSACVYKRETRTTGVVSDFRSEVRRLRALASMTKHHDQWVWWVDTGVKWRVLELLHVRPWTKANDSSECIPKQSVTSGRGSVYDRVCWATRNAGGYRSEV